jgi:hypothetical protein
MAITAHIVGPTFVTVMMDGTTHTINGDHPNYSAIREALKIKDHDTVEQLINVAKAIDNFSIGNIRVVGDKVFYGDFEVKGSVVQRIISMMREGFDAAPMLNFIENLMSNPSKRAVDELYGFLEATALPITEDGCFLAYKKVRDDYCDFYTGKMDNSIGTVLEMPRNQVDEDKDRTCSYGLHFCSLSYLPHYHGGSGRVMIVKINPRDVVAVPSDYNNAKGRTCRYEVIGEHVSENDEAFRSPVWTNVDDDDERELPDADEDYDADAEYDRGYEAGCEKADDDSANLVESNDTPPENVSDDFVEGYLDGYNETYYIDWERAATQAAIGDVELDKPYNDTPPDSCDDENSYRVAYADAWRDAKVSRLG